MVGDSVGRMGTAINSEKRRKWGAGGQGKGGEQFVGQGGHKNGGGVSILVWYDG
jgi:hypothetical protein